MPKLHLVSHEICPYAQRAAIALIEKNAPFERTNIDLNNKLDWFSKISPLGKVPLLQVDNEVIFESAVICAVAEDYHRNYLARHPHKSYIVIHDLPKLEQPRNRFPEIYQ